MSVLGKEKTLGAEQTPRGLLLTPLLALVAVLIYAATKHLDHGSTFWSVVAVGLATAGAAMLSGVLLGFLFGLPRVAVAARGSKADAEDGSGLETNSNLDEVSDWLTKILVGLGLVQLGRISHAVSGIGNELAPGFGALPGAKGFAVGLLLYSVIDGFLIGYIWTRVELSGLFRGAHENLLRRTVRNIDTTIRNSDEERRRLAETIQAARNVVESVAAPPAGPRQEESGDPGRS
jgi:hypothetical protein